jgi:CNH domain
VAVEWANADKLIIATAKQYTLINLLLGSIEEIISYRTTYSLRNRATPTITLLKPPYILLSRDSILIFLIFTEDGSIKYDIDKMGCLETFKWTSSPSNVLFIQPYIVGISERMIEVRNCNRTGDPVQIIQTRAALSLLSNKAFVLVSDGRSVWRLLPFDMEDQVHPDNSSLTTRSINWSLQPTSKTPSLFSKILILTMNSNATRISWL